MQSVARARSTDRRFYGVAEALVEENVDPENEGRVKVCFPWFSGEMVSEWCRVCQLYAGSDFGAYFVPEVGTEVLVAFVHGDMRLPVVLGGLYNGMDKPPSARNGSDPKYVQTKAGHKIVIEDASGSQSISIVDASGENSIVIDTEANKITISAQADIEIAAASGAITMNGSTGISLSSDANIDIQASGSVNVSGSTINLN